MCSSLLFKKLNKLKVRNNNRKLKEMFTQMFIISNRHLCKYRYLYYVNVMQEYCFVLK